jgi:hypothetical protein
MQTAHRVLAFIRDTVLEAMGQEMDQLLRVSAIH